MPKAPRAKRVPDAAGESFRVVNKAPNGEAEPYSDRSRQGSVAPWLRGADPAAESVSQPARPGLSLSRPVTDMSQRPSAKRPSATWLRGSAPRRRSESCRHGGSSTWPGIGCVPLRSPPIGNM